MERTINKIQVVLNLLLLIYGWFKITPWYQPLCFSSSQVLYFFLSSQSLEQKYQVIQSSHIQIPLDPRGKYCDSYSQSSTSFFIYTVHVIHETHIKRVGLHHLAISSILMPLVPDPVMQIKQEHFLLQTFTVIKQMLQGTGG